MTHAAGQVARRHVPQLPGGIARGESFAALLVVSLANGLANRVKSSIEDGLGEAALRLFGINAVLWFALYVIVRLGLEARTDERLHRFDGLIGLGVLAAALLPLPLVGTVAAIAAAGWLFVTSAGGTPTHRMALVGLAMSGPLLWGPVTMRLFAPEVVQLEAALIGGLTGLQTVSNVLSSPDGHSVFVIYSACSSLLNVSLAILLLVALTQRLNIRLSPRFIPTALFAVAATILVNIVRLACIGFMPQHYTFIHEGAGSMMFGLASLLLMGSVVVLGVSRVARPAL